MKSLAAISRVTYGERRRAAPRLCPEEVAIALSYNGSTHAVMMATPADLTDFAYGFSLTEGIATPDEIESIEVVETDKGMDLQIWLRPKAANRQSTRRRSMAGPVGCGLCGIDSLEEAVRQARPVTADLRLRPAQIMAAAAALTAHQPLHDETRAVHAAAFWTPEAGIVAAREDVGRHNALDKLAGALAAIPHGTGAVLITSRVSIDMVQKCAAIGAPVLIAVSAPTAAAVRMADGAGITLIAQARADRFDAYTHLERILDEARDVA